MDMPRIFIGELHVNNVNDTSGLFYGQNVQYNWKNSEKINEGFGELSGKDNIVHGDLLIVGDQDLVDTYLNNNRKREHK
jgi:hypothetical protein